MSTSLNEFDDTWAPPGKAVDDRGGKHDRIQDAVDNADSFVMVGPGTFPEAVTITTAELAIRGAGPSTIIDGDTNTALTVDANEVNVNQLSVQSTQGAQAGANGLEVTSTASGASIGIVRAQAADADGFQISGPDASLFACIAESAESSGFRLAGARAAGLGLTVKDRVGGDGVAVSGDNCSIVGASVDGAGVHGIDVHGGTVGGTVAGCVATNSGDIGIRISGDGQSLVANEATGSTNANIDVSNATNLRPAANTPAVPKPNDAAPNGPVFMSEIPNGDFAAIPVHIPSNQTLNVWSWGCRTDGQTTPSGLTVELFDETNAVSVASENTAKTTGNPVTSLSAGSSALDATLRVNNDTGTDPINAGGEFHYTVS